MSKSNLLLLHGALGSQQQFEQINNHLSNYFEVHTLNFAGHGGRPSNNSFSIELFTRNALDFLKENNIDQTHIFGYSMGGYVGLNLAKNHPEMVRSIVTLGTKFNWTKETAAKEIKMLNPAIIEAKVPKFAKRLEQTHYPNDWKILLEKTAKMMIDLGDGNRLTDLDLNAIPHPILIGIGSLDKMVSIEESENAANQLEHGTLRIIEGFYHPIEKNDAEQLALFITAFLNGK